MMPATLTFIRATAGVCILALLAGCGFEYRKGVDLPPQWRAIHLESPGGALAQTVRDRLTGAGVLAGRDQAGILLRLGGESFERHNLTIGSNARATEFELVMTATMQVRDASGTELLPTTTLRAQRGMTHDPQNITGKEEQLRLLRDDMRRDLTGQVMRRLNHLAAPRATRPSSARPPIQTVPPTPVPNPVPIRTPNRMEGAR